MGGWIVGWMAEYFDRLIDRWMLDVLVLIVGWMDRWMEGWIMIMGSISTFFDRKSTCRRPNYSSTDGAIV